MSLYTLSEFMKTIKEDMGISELPKQINDKMMIDRFKRSALATFSQLCPNPVNFMVNSNELIKDENIKYNITPNGKFLRYRIPKFAYGDRSIISVVNVEPCRANCCNDYYLGYGAMQSPLDVISAIANVRTVATTMAQCYPSLTWDFQKPDVLTLFNAYSGESYQVTALLSHDINLTTVPDDAFFNLEQLALYDMEEYFYNKLKRYQRTNVGVGEIELNIDDWSGARQEKVSLVERWAEDCNLDFDTIRIF